MKTLVLAALVPLAGCLADAPDATTSTEDIYGQVAGAHATTKEVAWDVAFSSLNNTSYTLTSFTPAAFLYPITTLRMFYRNSSDGCLYSYTNADGAASWTRDTSLDVVACGDVLTDSAPAAIQWSATRFDVFYFMTPFGQSAPSHLDHVYYDGSWHTEDLGTLSTFPTRKPAVASWADGHIDVLWRDTTGNMRRKQFDRAKKGASGFTAGGWQIGDSLVASGVPDLELAAAEPAVNEIDVAFRNSSNNLSITRTTNNSSFATQSFAVALDGAPSAASWGGGSLMVMGSSSGNVVSLQRTTASGILATSVFTTDHAFSVPVAASSTSRTNRVDFLAMNGTSVIHAFYQESLPGFAELSNPDEDNWCWADSSGAAINYMNLGVAGWTPEATCQFVSTDEGENCCGIAAPAECHRSGSAKSVYDDYGFSWDIDDEIDYTTLRIYLQQLHQPVIMREQHNTDSGGHEVVLRDAYTQHGVQYVEIADPSNNGLTWVWDWNTLINYNGNWHVDYMIAGLSRD
ncbi:MAG TPA: hypothetical protein VGM88_06745 [Kofleriaceae bacterium]|jgi:hypothetical protein